MIHVSLTQAEPPNCICLAVVGRFQETLLVSPIEPGDYTITVTDFSCGQPIPAGSTEFTFGAASAIPTLDPWAGGALALLLAAAAVWRLRS